MKTRAVVGFEGKTSLEIVELGVEGPKAIEALMEIKASGIRHTDACTLDGLDSEGLEDINGGFDLMHAGQSIRSVMVY